MTDFNMPPGVSARDIPGQDEVPDLVEQLQASAPRASWPEDADLMTEAADEITRLRAEVEALREDASKIPDILFDGWSVLQALTGPAKKRTSPENVSDVLDAVVNILKAAPAARAKEKE